MENTAAIGMMILCREYFNVLKNHPVNARHMYQIVLAS